MKKVERNTNTMSAERIWIRKTIDHIWFNNNDQYTYNSPERTLKVLSEIVEKGRKEGYTDMVVMPTYSESTSDDLEEYYIEVIGWRLETDEEYRRRLDNILAAVKRERNNFELRKQYYEKDCHLKRTTELENAIDTLRIKNRQ